MSVYKPPSTPNMKYKASGRYQFGWNDPRVMSWSEKFEDIQTLSVGHYARDMTNDQLKAAWLLVYGDRPITFEEIKRKWAEDETADTMRVAQETHLRGLLYSQHDFAKISNIYVLKDKLNASN